MFIYMKINIIVTYANNYVIGNDDKIPWNYKEDIDYFNKITKRTTESNKKNAVIIGYTTYSSLPMKNFKDRYTIVITEKDLKSTNTNDLFFVDSISGSIELCRELINKELLDKIFIAGGEQIYSYFCKSYYYTLLDKIYITKIHKNYKGNKFFYPLEDKFYYLDIIKSVNEENIEYYVLQYDKGFKNPESTYLQHLEKIFVNETDTDIEYLQLPKIKLDIDLSKYFPIFNIIKKNIDQLLKNIFISINSEKINPFIDNIVNKIKDDISTELNINLSGVSPYNSVYSFEYDDKQISCRIIHNNGTILNEVIYNIIFSSLLVYFIAFLTNLKPNKLDYQCIENYCSQKEKYIIEKVAYNVPDPLPKLEIKNRDQKYIIDFIQNDLIFNGIDI